MSRATRDARSVILVALALSLCLWAVAQAATAQPASTTTTSALVDASTYINDCFICHSLATLPTVKVDGEEKSVQMDQAAYAASVHGHIACNGCHVGFTHDPHAAVSSASDFAAVASEACRNCHADQFLQYGQSYHGRLTVGATVQGTKAPTCIDCHGFHDVASTTTPEFRESIDTICGRCHQGREQTYLDTYHGKAITLGRTAVATCSDCHGAHRILPVADPESTLSATNKLATCQKCHPKATANFTTFRVHIRTTSPSAPLVIFLVALFYFVLISIVFAFGGIHTILYIYRGLKDRAFRRRKGGS